MREKTISTQTLYEGRILALDTLRVELEDGREAFREIVRHAPAVTVIARRPDGRFVFVRQFRKAVEEDVLECVAGILKPGENPEEGARRELKEETGLDADTLTLLGTTLPTPGYCSERIWLFYARVTTQVDALALDEDEHVEPVVLDRAQVEAAIISGEIHDAKTLAAWLLYEKIVAAREQEGTP